MKNFDIRKTFETFLREPLSILTEGLFQIVNINTGNNNSKTSSVNIDRIKNKTQITVINSDNMYNLFQTVLYKRRLQQQKEKAEALK